MQWHWHYTAANKTNFIPILSSISIICPYPVDINSIKHQAAIQQRR